MKRNHVVSRARCGLVKNSSVSCPGAKLMATKTNLALTAIEQTTVPDSLTSGTSKLTLNQGHWEDFQDLTIYCETGSKMMDNSAQQSGEELNTPPVTAQDEFYFSGLRSSAGDGIDFDDDVEPWGAQEHRTNTSQTELWSYVSNWLSTDQHDIDDEEDVVQIGVDIDEVDDSDFNIIDEKPQQLQFPQQQQNQDSLISSGRDFLLSQSADYKQNIISPLVNREREEKSLIKSRVDITSSSIKSEPQYFSQQCEPAPVKNINNNFNNAINFNDVVLIRNNNSNNNNCSYKNNNLKSLCDKDHQTNNCVSEPSRLNSKSVSKNRRDPVNSGGKNLSFIFKSEEPLIGVSNKQLSSCTVMSNIDVPNNIVNNCVEVSEIVSSPESVSSVLIGSNNIKLDSTYVSSFSNQVRTTYSNEGLMAGKSSNLSEDNSPEIVKSEPMDSTGVCVNVIDLEKTSPVDDLSFGKQLRFPINENMKKPGLKLDIDSAARLVTSIETPTSTPTAGISASCDITSTPEVLRPLYSGTGFNLLSYIIGDGAGDDSVLGSSSNNGNQGTEIKKNVQIETTLKPVEKQTKVKAIIVKKCDSAFELPSLPVVKEEEVTTLFELPSLPVIKEEEVTTDESFNQYHSSFGDSSFSTVEEKVTPRRMATKRKRIPKKSEDMESDLSNLSDFMEDDDKNDTTYMPSTSYRRKRTTSSMSRTSSECGRSTERHTNYCKQRKLSRDTDSSDHDSIASSSNADRYRELRDRNNEASRRSRLNRKSREQEMRQQAVQLEDENKKLKRKADEMEKLVKRLRESLLKLVLKKSLKN